MQARTDAAHTRHGGWDMLTGCGTRDALVLLVTARRSRGQLALMTSTLKVYCYCKRYSLTGADDEHVE
eukprot:9363776-Pyramimonas_sp.AAC.1